MQLEANLILGIECICTVSLKSVKIQKQIAEVLRCCDSVHVLRLFFQIRPLFKEWEDSPSAVY